MTYVVDIACSSLVWFSRRWPSCNVRQRRSMPCRRTSLLPGLLLMFHAGCWCCLPSRLKHFSRLSDGRLCSDRFVNDKI